MDNCRKSVRDCFHKTSKDSFKKNSRDCLWFNDSFNCFMDCFKNFSIMFQKIFFRKIFKDFSEINVEIPLLNSLEYSSMRFPRFPLRVLLRIFVGFFQEFVMKYFQGIHEELFTFIPLETFKEIFLKIFKDYYPFSFFRRFFTLFSNLHFLQTKMSF